MKKFLVLFVFINSMIFGQMFKVGEVQGIFMSIGLGPKFPLGEFAENQNVGVGFDVGLSYADNELAPVFLYGKIGFQHYPGNQEFYARSEYSHFSSNVIMIQGGGRYYFAPLYDDKLLLLPIVEFGFSWGLYDKLHQFKKDSGILDFTEENSKFGFHVGAGFSMFLMDVIAYYNYLHNNQYISFDLRARIPIYIKY